MLRAKNVQRIFFPTYSFFCRKLDLIQSDQKPLYFLQNEVINQINKITNCQPLGVASVFGLWFKYFKVQGFITIFRLFGSMQIESFSWKSINEVFVEEHFCQRMSINGKVNLTITLKFGSISGAMQAAKARKLFTANKDSNDTIFMISFFTLMKLWNKYIGNSFLSEMNKISNLNMFSKERCQFFSIPTW